MNKLSTHDDQRQSLENLYETVNGIHSHLISGPDDTSFDKLLKDLENRKR